jgi:orotate phosphoribosyltransferase
MASPPIDFRQGFLEFAIAHKVLRFGAFVNKGGRRTPYFFNAGLFSDGASLAQLGRYYAQALRAANVSFDMLFGPAYKGITLAATTAIALAETGKNVPFSFNRKEAKDHGEGGDIVGAPLQGDVVIIDDVITDGGAKREAIERVQSAGARAVAILIAFDRQERGLGELSAVQELKRDFGVPLISIATLDDLCAYIEREPSLAVHAAAIQGYRATYGAK